ncbi:outer membrane protein assembly factor BamC, partial [Salmonella enterica]|uniref:outer membrane protein assembly factor BamC n=1 Tax=Salmonella enterica TaxID=28901 RepID=UPI0032989223
RLPAALEKVGMEVTDSTRSQGSMAVSYKPVSDSDWRDQGASDPGLASGDYKIQVGELDNRSSLQSLDPKGHTLS